MQSRFVLSAVTLTLACVLAGCGASPNTVTPKRTSTAAKPATTAAATKTTAAAQTTTAQQPTSLQVAHQPVAVAPATTTASSTLATTPTTTAPATTTTTTTPVADVAPTTTTSTKTVGIESTGDSPVLTPTSTTSVSVASASALSAEITSEKNGVLLGIGSYKCTVTVTNSSDTEQTGMLQLTFMNGENPAKTAPVVQLVTVPAGGSKSFDFDINEISITAQRAQSVDFSTGYYTANQGVLVLGKSKFAGATSLSQLKDARIGVQVGTTSYQAVNDILKPSKQVSVFNSTDDEVSALQNGQVDAIVTDMPTVFYLASAELTGGKILGQFSYDGGGAPEQFGLLLAKGSGLTACVDQALAKLTSSGELKTITDQWLSASADVPELKQ